MRILAIRGENLGSLAEPFEVCLSAGPLGGAGIFAITGPTGAGKSTILDAMCLALYDNVPRLQGVAHVLVGRPEQAEREREATDDVRTIVHRGAAGGFAEVDFVGVDGRRYRARWSVHRARGQSTGRLQNQSVTLADIETDVRVGGGRQETLAAIREKVGLTFDQFRRSVLLAQGDFAAFIRAKANERAELLERMTGTEIYSTISRLAFERNRSERLVVRELEVQQEGIVLRSDEERAQIEGEVAQCEAAAARLSKDEAAHRELESRAILVEQRGKDLQEAQRVVEEAERRLDEETKRVAGAEAWIAKNAAVEPLARSWDRWSVDLDRLIEARARLAKLAKELEEGARTAATLEREATEREAALAAARSVVEREEAAVVAAEKAVAAVPREALVEERKRLDRRERLLNDVSHLVAKVGEEAVRRTRFVSAAEKAEGEAETARGVGEKAAVALTEIAGQLAELEEQHAAAAAARDMEGHRGHLVAGEPCPLCGSVEHPWAAGSPVGDRADELAAGRATLTDRRTEAAAATRASEERVRGFLREAKARRAEAAQIAAGMERLSKSWAGLQKKVRGEFDVVLDADPADPAVGEWCTGVRAVVDGARAKLDGQEAQLGTLDREAGVARARRDEAREGVETARTVLEDVRRRQQETGARKVRLDTEVGNLEANRRTLLAGLVTACPGAEAARAELEEKPGSVRELWAARVAEYAGKCGERDDARGRQARLQAAAVERRDAVKVRGEALNEVRRSFEGRALELRVAASREAVGAALGVLRAGLAEVQERRGAAQEKLRTDADNRRRAEELGRKLEAARAGLGRWARLNELLGSSDGKRFREFAQGLTLELLLAHANRQLEDLVRRYRLERVPTADVELQVVDQEMGDEIRGMASLSGGETFLVSLGLALGLASMASTDLAIESLFIDEGFGSLDSETLETSIAALDALQATGRQVGIISHVDGLGERVGLQVRVEKIGGGRSRVIVEGEAGSG